MPVLAPMGSRIRITLALFDPAADFFFGDFITLADPEASLGENALATTFILVKPAKVGEVVYDLSKARKVETGGNVKPGDKSSLAPGGGLAAHEVKGGHLIDRHIGKTDEQLLERLKSNPKITGSSTFKDRMTAERVADTVLKDPKNMEKIQKWLSDPNSRPTLPLKFKGDGEIIGRSVTRNSEVIENVTNAKIILRKDKNGSFILTGYPVK
ncbi:RNase A-like domain-containing protein [Shouchella clausii]|uniref:RNase A-like domain-containing protein n=1 Tax=Shouchella clausii TaxID=79880 RepID=UPI0028A1F3E0|nr:RNase A-like domain-containing protein [Shouchella clausii]